MFSLLTPEKSFDDRWVGHRRWNERYALHRRRMQLAESAAALRRAAAFLVSKRLAGCEALERDGYAVLPDFLPDVLFQALSVEAEAAIARSREAHPYSGMGAVGFGAKQPFPGGFDRWDGGTLNRFLDLGRSGGAALSKVPALPALRSLTRQIVGVPHLTSKTQLYLTVNGNDGVNHDIQRDLHRDTYFSAMKFWLFLRPVTAADGPFTYAPGSHRLTPKRLAWEHAEARRIVESGGADPNTGGSFRIMEDQLAGLGLPKPVACECSANTLVIANTLGFHARGRAKAGTERLAVYGWRRPFPFGLMGW